MGGRDHEPSDVSVFGARYHHHAHSTSPGRRCRQVHLYILLLHIHSCSLRNSPPVIDYLTIVLAITLFCCCCIDPTRYVFWSRDWSLPLGASPLTTALLLSHSCRNEWMLKRGQGVWALILDACSAVSVAWKGGKSHMVGFVYWEQVARLLQQYYM